MDTDIKIFFNERVVVLSDNDLGSYAIDRKHVYRFENRNALVRRIEKFEQSVDERLYIIHSDLNELFGHVKKCFKYVEAAGGFVMLPDGRALIIKRLGKWDLPKGKAEKGESPQDTALREVMEECGLEKTPIITGELAHTWHTYYHDGKHILKHTAWYEMMYDGNERLKPQYDEDITAAVWFPQNLLNVVMLNTYQSIKQLIHTIKNQNLKIENQKLKIKNQIGNQKSKIKN